MKHTLPQRLTGVADAPAATSPPTAPKARQCHVGQGMSSPLSIPDMEALQEITSEEANTLLSLASFGRARGDFLGSSGTDYRRLRHTTAQSQQAHDGIEVQVTGQPSPTSMVTGTAAAFASGSRDGQGIAMPPSSSSPTPAPTSPTVATSPGPSSPPLDAVEELGEISRLTDVASSSLSEKKDSGTEVARAPRLVPISDTEVLDAERLRWSPQLVQERWLHSELHGERWGEDLILRSGAAYRTRAIASRTKMQMSHTKGLCLALNVDTSMFYNAGDRADDEEGEPRIEDSTVQLEGGRSQIYMWRSPAFIPGDANAVLSTLSSCLKEQYDELAPRSLTTVCCSNSRVPDLMQALSDIRKEAGDAKVIFHYFARGVPPPRRGNIYLMNGFHGTTGYGAPPCNKVALETLRNRIGFPLVFVADCAEAGELLQYYIQMCEEQHHQRYFTSSREYQLKSSRQVSAVELDRLAEGIPSSSDSFGVTNGGDTGGDAAGRRKLRNLDGSAPATSAVLQDFYFIGASGMSLSGGSASKGHRSFSSGHPAARSGGGASATLGGLGAGNAEGGALRLHPRLPSDILTSCVTTPLRMALLWFIAEHPRIRDMHPLLIEMFPGVLTDKKTPLGQLQWYLQSVMECIAWSTLPLSEYSRLFREDVYVAPLYRGYLLAERIIVGGLGGQISVYPPLPPTHTHALWITWDNFVERSFVAVLRAARPSPPRCWTVLEFRSWLDRQIVEWRCSHEAQQQQQLARKQSDTGTSGCTQGVARKTLVFAMEDGPLQLPQIFYEELLSMEALLDGITQQSFDRPRRYFIEQGVGLPYNQPSGTMGEWCVGGESGGSDSYHRRGAGYKKDRRGRSHGSLPPSNSLGDAVHLAPTGQHRRRNLHAIAECYKNSLLSSYPQGGVRDASASTGSNQAGVATIGASRPVTNDALQPSERGSGAAERGVSARRGGAPLVLSHPLSRQQDKASSVQDPTNQRGFGADSYNGCYEKRVGGGWGGGATAGIVSNPLMPAAAAAAPAAALYVAPSLKTDYVGNRYSSGGPDQILSSGGCLSADTLWHPHPFPFMERLPHLLQCLLVAAHREKATELVCRLVDCGPAAVLQCAEANIYRFVLDRYWSRPDLRILMPATLFIYCKSCYTDPEIIGSANQRDVVIRACTQVLQSPVVVPRSSTVRTAGGPHPPDPPGTWQATVLGPYATPDGQRLLAVALLTQIALHSDEGRDVCHRNGAFQLCCQLLEQTHVTAPIVYDHTSTFTVSFSSDLRANAGPPLPRAPLPSAASHRRTATPSTGSLPAADMTTYRVTLLALFVALLCNWKPAASEESEDGSAPGTRGDVGLPGKSGNPSAASAKTCEFLQPLDGTVHELPPTSAGVLAAGLECAVGTLQHCLYSDASILRGATIRCLKMVLISPGPSQESRARYAEVMLRRFYQYHIPRSEVNTDLRLEVVGLAYATFRWMLDQLREDIALEEIGHHVALWVYRWYSMDAKGHPPATPFVCLDPNLDAVSKKTWMPTSVSARVPDVLPPGSVYSYHRRGGAPLPTAAATAASSVAVSRSDMAGGHYGRGQSVIHSSSMFYPSTFGGLRHHVTAHDHRRLQAFLPPLSGVVRLFFEHTQDVCPYLRSYVSKVIVEEFSFLKQSWYDEYGMDDTNYSPSRIAEEDLRGGCDVQEEGMDSSVRWNGGSTYTSRHHLSAKEALQHPGISGVATAVGTGTEGSFVEPANYSTSPGHLRSRPVHSHNNATGFEDIDDLEEPNPMAVRKCMLRLLHLASANITPAEGVSSSPSLVNVGRIDSSLHASHHGMSMNLHQGEASESAPGAALSYASSMNGGVHLDPCLTAATHTNHLHGGRAGSCNPQVFDSDGASLHPLWALDSNSMVCFAYGVLGFLERFMLEALDNNDPRHPMNLEKEDALYQYSKRVEGNMRAYVQDGDATRCGVAGGTSTSTPCSSAAAVAATSTVSVRDEVSARFYHLGVGDVSRTPAWANGTGVSRRAAGDIDVVLFHPSDPFVVTSTTGGLIHVWDYGSAAAELTSGPRHTKEKGENLTVPSLRLRAGYFLRDVVARPASLLSVAAQPRFIYDRYGPYAEAANSRASNHTFRNPRNGIHDERGGRGYSQFLWNSRGQGRAGGNRLYAFAASSASPTATPVVSPSSSRGHSQLYDGVGNLHFIDTPRRALLCAVRRTGSVELFSNYTSATQVRRVTSFETLRAGEGQGQHQCLSSYQAPSGLLYVGVSEGPISAWDLGSEQRLASTVVVPPFEHLGHQSAAALAAHPTKPLEFAIGDNAMGVHIFDLRAPKNIDAGTTGEDCRVMSLRYPSSGCDNCVVPLSPLCARVLYSRRYPTTVMSSYACGTVVVWDLRYTQQPYLTYRTAEGVAAGVKASPAVSLSGAPASSAAPACVSPMSVVRQVDVHSNSKRFLTLTTTTAAMQLVEVDWVGGETTTASPVGHQVYPLRSSFDEEGGTRQLCEPAAACFHDFSPLLGVGCGNTVQLYGALSIGMACLEVGDA